MLKAIIFDCFGVLYPQASGAFFDKNKELFQNHLEAMDELNLKIDLGEVNRGEFFAGLERVTGIPASAIQNEMDSQLKVDQKLVDLIRELKKRYKIGLLSNAGKEEISIIYRDKIDGLFDSLTVSYEVQLVKPNAEIFRTCLSRLGVEAKEAIFIDDSMKNIKAAQEIGIPTLYYPNFGDIPENLTELAKF